MLCYQKVSTYFRTFVDYVHTDLSMNNPDTHTTAHYMYMYNVHVYSVSTCIVLCYRKVSIHTSNVHLHVHILVYQQIILHMCTDMHTYIHSLI